MLQVVQAQAVEEAQLVVNLEEQQHNPQFLTVV
jgi:hypothetical protein